MKPYFQDDAVQLFQGDCFEVMKGLESVDTIITDPPYGLHFMGKKWDYEIPSVAVFTEMLRVAKCGATLLCFGGTRTWHRIAVNIEDAGWEIRDTLMFLYGSGFPKSLNIEKALLKQCTCGNMVAYETAKQNTEYNLRPLPEAHISQEVTNPATDREVLQPSLQEQGLQIQQFTSAKNVREGQSCLEGRINLQEVKGELQGSGLSTMPEGISADGKGRRIHNAAQIGNGSTLGEITTEDRSNTPHRPQSKKQQYSEPCAFCKQWGTQKAREWEGYGTALKPAFEPIIMAMKPCEGTFAENALKYGVAGLNIDGARVGDFTNNQPSGMTRFNDYRHGKGKYPTNEVITNTIGRFPANVIHDGSEEVLARFPQTIGGGKGIGQGNGNHTASEWTIGGKTTCDYADSGSASRFFYCAKASKAERNVGCEGLDEQMVHRMGHGNNEPDPKTQDFITYSRNNHPTVKPLALMEYLCTLTKTPTGGIVLDPYMGSGTTGMACKNIGRDFIGIEISEEYIEIAKRRIESAKRMAQTVMNLEV